MNIHIQGYKPKPRWQTRKWYKFILLCTFMMFVYVSEQVGIVYLDQSIYQTSTEKDVMKQDVSQLKIEVSNLKKSSRIKRIAMEDLGLKVPVGLPRTLF